MCMMNPKHIYSHDSDSLHPANIDDSLLDHAIMSYSTTCKDDDNNSNKDSTESTPQYLSFEPVEFDPSLDLSNMDQYQPKIYKVVPVYEKVSDPAALSNSGVNNNTAPPAYDELYQQKQANEKLPDYNDLERLESGELQEVEQDENKSPKRSKAAWFHYFFLWFIIFYFLMPLDEYSSGCSMNDDEQKDLDTQEAFVNQMPSTRYNLGNIVYSLSTSADKMEDSDTVIIITWDD